MDTKPPDIRAGGRPPLRVLVIEDDEDTATSFGMLLRLYGYSFEVQLARDGPSACRAAQTSSPDIILLNIGLPQMDGWQVAKQIREQSAGKRLLIVAMSGFGMEADRLRSDEAGIDLHLVKPVTPEELEKVLRRFQAVVGVPASP
jgi:two-component system CheB/CheR fusion protein